jgi:hypothetical protein
MTELEQYIYDQALSRLPDMIESLKNHKYDGLVKYPFYIDGCINSIVFEVYGGVAKPYRIEYKYGIGEATSLIGGSTALFDDYEFRSIPFKL